jgi:hypothetical protein
MTNQAAKVGNWLLRGDTGLSSMALAAVWLGADGKDLDAPRDPSDFKRCVTFLEECVPEDEWIGLLGQMARMDSRAGGKWSSILLHWHKLLGLYEEEKRWERAPKLYGLMKEIGL